MLELVEPFVRIILVNFDGGDVTLRCLDSLTSIDYPSDRYEIVMVDNGSIDGLYWRAPQRFPGVKVIESFSNEGFARGNNLAMENRDGVDLVALINNDVIVDKSWLITLVRSLEKHESWGGVGSKMLFNRIVTGAEITTSDVPLRVGRVHINGCDVTSKVVFDERFVHADGYRELRGTGSFWVDASDLNGDDGATISVQVFSTVETEISLRTISHQQKRQLAPGSQIIYIDGSPPMRAINNAGGGIFAGLHGGDIGFKELDLGQYEEEREVFSFCGGAVLLRAEFLEEVGLFDPSFFLYYEDLDLSWRGHFKGWSYGYCPSSVVYHEHAYSSGEWSPFFLFWVDRNRRLTLVKNAPLEVAIKTSVGALVWGLRDTVTPLCRSLLRRQRPDFARSRYRLRQLGSFFKALPLAIKFRRIQMRNAEIKPTFVYDWTVTRQ